MSTQAIVVYETRFGEPDLDFIEQTWIPALESGTFTQTKGTLHDTFGFCCLGVASDLIGADWIAPIDRGTTYRLSSALNYGGTNDFPYTYNILPIQHERQIGLTQQNGIQVPPCKSPYDYAETTRHTKIKFVDLADLNDCYDYDFNAIAAVLRRIVADWREYVAMRLNEREAGT